MQKKAQKWLMLSARLAADTDADILSHVCFEAGALGCEERESMVIAWFPQQNARTLMQDVNQRLASLLAAGILQGTPSLSTSVIEEQDWHSGWRRFFKPILVDRVFCVRPPWEKTPEPVAHEIIIEPKQAFGTGNHATTWLLLKKIAELGAALPERALDVGTGSGILAIAHALYRSESRVTACDIDPVAVENAQENAAVNGVAENIALFTGSLPALKQERFPLIYANLQSHIIEPLLPDFYRLAAEDGIILFSGILAEEEDKMRRALDDDARWELYEITRRDEWIAMCVRKRA